MATQLFRIWKTTLKQLNVIVDQKLGKPHKSNLLSLGTFWMKLPVGLKLELLQIIVTCGFMPSTDCQLASVHVRFFLSPKIVKQVMESFSRIGTRKSCQPVESLTCPNCQPELKQILRNLYWSDLDVHLLGTMKTMVSERGSLLHPQEIVIGPSSTHLLPNTTHSNRCETNSSTYS